MNFLKRAFYSTKAKVGRSLLLTFVFSAILIFILAGLTIQSASLTAAENAKKSMGATVTLSANMENAMKEMQENTRDGERPDPSSFSITPIDLDDVEKITALDNLSSYSLSSTTTVNAKSFDAISSEDSSDDSDTEQQGGPGGMQMPEMASQGDISISGTNATATASSFTGGTAEIIDGVGITEADADSNKAVIETNLAEANDIAVGDTIKVKGDDKTYKLSVVGIYKSTEATDSRSMQMASLNPYNTIYTSYTFANKVKGSDYKNTADSVVFNVTDPEKMDTFVKAAEATGLDTDTYSLTTNDQVYQQ
ncbi:MAG TPA: ABC transporter permease, partial [Candidatus Kurthia intestinigallinarum]|nr:ABC transporter permease [Candidatus Kurthia intestinigallinarum]